MPSRRIDWLFEERQRLRCLFEKFTYGLFEAIAKLYAASRPDLTLLGLRQNRKGVVTVVDAFSVKNWTPLLCRD